jgi:hypothetical protein
MTHDNKYISINSDVIHRRESWSVSDNTQLSSEDSSLFEAISDSMKGQMDLEEVRNDPSLPEIETDVITMISDYYTNCVNNSANKNFVRDSFFVTNGEENIAKEISDIKFEIHKSNVNELTAEWVKEWHEKKKRDVLRDSNNRKIREFVTSSLEAEKIDAEIKPEIKESTGIKRSLLIRYVSLSAAAVIGAFILIRTLLPSHDPEMLYNSYYKPFDAISSVTRGINENKQNGFSAAVESYRIGDYPTAAAGFSNVLLNDTSIIAPHFFMGITQMALGKYSQAVSLLSSIAGRPGEYRKETIWYLGLACLKTGEKEKASDYFKLLAQSPGFYSEPSGEILRRLK